MSEPQEYDVYITVHRSEPVDLQKFRHTAFYFVAVDESLHFYCHVTGSTGEFEFEMRTEYNASNSKSLDAMVTVGRVTLSAEDISELMEGTEVKNEDPEFNCQTWVQDGLARMWEAGYITEEEYSTVLDGMVEATLAAADEDQVQW